MKNSSLAALFFLISMSFFPEFQMLTPVNIAVALLIIILYQLLIFYNKPEHLDRMFVAGFTTGLGSLIYTPFLAWFFLLPVSFIIFRIASWRAWMAAFTGLVTPFFYFATWAFWNDHFYASMVSFFGFFTVYELPRLQEPFYRYLPAIVLALLFIWGYLFHPHVTDKVVEIRAKTNVLLWTILFMAATLPFARPFGLHHLLLATPVYSLVMARTLIQIKKVPVAETILLVCFLTTIINVYLIRFF